MLFSQNLSSPFNAFFFFSPMQEVGIEDEVEDVDEQFLEQMRSSLIARKFTLTYIVSRLAAGDVTTAIPLLKAANSILASDPNTFTDEAPFAATLARRFVGLFGWRSYIAAPSSKGGKGTCFVSLPQDFAHGVERQDSPQGHLLGFGCEQLPR